MLLQGDTEAAALETDEAEDALPMLGSAAHLSGLKLLSALAAYQRLLPGWMADSRADVARLMSVVSLWQAAYKHMLPWEV